MDRSKIDLSVILPAYNEEARIPGPLRSIAGYLEAQSYASELVIVDDGSRDATSEVVRDVARHIRMPVRLLSYENNMGKGYALKVGFAHAAGHRIMFSDADLATPIEETSRLLKVLDNGADVAIGSRKTAGSQISVRQPWYREQMGKMFTWLVRRLIAEVSDATCGFKAFQREAGRDLFSRLRIHDWTFDAEILFLTRRLGYRLEEIPVRWADQEGSRVRLLRDSARSLIGLARIKMLAASRAYEREVPLDQAVDEWANSGARTGA